MPTYDYVCPECSHTFEHFQSMSSQPLESCPQCGGSVKRKIGSGIAPIFKGSGFYQTDYKPASGESKSSSSAKGEPKPAAAAADSSPGTAPAATD